MMRHSICETRSTYPIQYCYSFYYFITGTSVKLLLIRFLVLYTAQIYVFFQCMSSGTIYSVSITM